MNLLSEVNNKWKHFIEKEKVKLIVTKRPELVFFLKEMEVIGFEDAQEEEHRPNWLLTVLYKGETLKFSDYDDCFPSPYPHLLKDEYKEIEFFLESLQKIDIESYIFGNGVVGK
jgi:hypothetical protein